MSDAPTPGSPSQPEPSLLTGVLQWYPDDRTVKLRTADGKTRLIEASCLDVTLVEQYRSDPAALSERSVEYIVRKARIRQVRPQGKQYIAPPTFVTPTQPTTPRPAAPTGQPEHRGKNSRTPTRGSASDRAQGDSPTPAFHNPYNFVPFARRPSADSPANGPATSFADGQAAPHDRYLPDHYSGRLRLRLTVVTPLLIPDASRASADTSDQAHLRLPLRIDGNGKPWLPSTSVKGMLRSAYEAVTNSRLGVFTGHDEALGYRPTATSANDLVPVRIEEGPDGLLRAIKTDVALLPRYKGKDGKGVLLKYAPGSAQNRTPQHGDRVCVRIQGQGRGKAARLKVRDIVPAGIALPPATQRPPDDRTGVVCITGDNAKNKKYERVFLDSSADPASYIVDDSVRAQWDTLMKDYAAQHSAEDVRAAPPNDLANAWSEHLRNPERRKLQDGTMCYAEIEIKNGRLSGLYPVTISRRVYAESPQSCLEADFAPATRSSKLSPADRVFGWVSTSPEEGAARVSARRGHLRLSPMRCVTPAGDAVQWFGSGPKSGWLPLAILGAPKPSRGAFYVTRSTNGGGSPIEYYGGRSTLRGRKVYPHHRGLPQGYWDASIEAAGWQGEGTTRRWREYRRPEDAHDSQNRSIDGWVARGTTFETDCAFTNLSAFELGALLWLCTLPAGHFLRLGSGKPLGFGSVRLDAVLPECDIADGNEWATRFAAVSDFVPSGPSDGKATELQRTFADAVIQNASVATVEDASWIKAFMRSSAGFDDDLPVHYPRMAKPSSPTEGDVDAPSYEWFVRNGPDQELPFLAHDPGLPLGQPK